MHSIEELPAPNGKCEICEFAQDPIWGIKGEGNPNVLIILQSSDFRALQHPNGYTGAFLESLTGRDIHKIIKEDWRNIAVVNCVKCHFKEQKEWRDPKTEEYRDCRENLKYQIEQLDPSLVLCCGTWATKAVFGENNYKQVKAKRDSVRYKQTEDTIFAIATHPRQFTCPVKAELTDMVERFRVEEEKKQTSLQIRELTLGI